MLTKEQVDKIREKLNELGKIIAFLHTDDETYEVGEDIEKIWTEALSLLPKPRKGTGQAPDGEVEELKKKEGSTMWEHLH